MPIRLLLALSLALGLNACKDKEKPQGAAEEQGAAIARQRIQEPIDRARQAAGAAEDALPTLLDSAANVYHKPGCKAADPGTMETVNLAQAKQRGAKPDPACFPAP